jgi:hypothetical protein
MQAFLSGRHVHTALHTLTTLLKRGMSLSMSLDSSSDRKAACRQSNQAWRHLGTRHRNRDSWQEFAAQRVWRTQVEHINQGATLLSVFWWYQGAASGAQSMTAACIHAFILHPRGHGPRSSLAGTTVLLL